MWEIIYIFVLLASANGKTAFLKNSCRQNAANTVNIIIDGILYGKTATKLPLASANFTPVLFDTIPHQSHPSMP